MKQLKKWLVEIITDTKRLWIRLEKPIGHNKSNKIYLVNQCLNGGSEFSDLTPNQAKTLTNALKRQKEFMNNQQKKLVD